MSSGFNNGSCNEKEHKAEPPSVDSRRALNNSVELSAEKAPSQICVGSPGID